MIHRNDDAALARDALSVTPFNAPKQTTDAARDGPQLVEYGLRERARVKSRAIARRSFVDSVGKAQSITRTLIKLINQLGFVPEPCRRQLRVTQLIVIPSAAVRAIEATVLNRFRFRQTD